MECAIIYHGHPNGGRRGEDDSGEAYGRGVCADFPEI
jgi:hypothetical protein